MKIVIKLTYLFIFVFLFFSCSNSRQKEEALSNKEKLKKELLAMSNVMYEKNNYTEAINIFNEILKIDTTIGEVYYRQGYCYAQLFKYDISSKNYLKAIDLDHRLEDSYFSLGCNYAAIYDYERALFYFNKVLQINPGNNKAKEQVNFLKVQNIKNT